MGAMGLVARGTLVFVIDDEVEVRQSVADLLTLEGYEARPFPSADAAWSALTHDERPALIILDLWIPGMSSGEFVQRLRASQHAGVPVLVLSGTRSQDVVESDVDAVSQKPIEATTLVRAVDKLVRKGARTAGGGPRPARRAPRAERSAPAARRTAS